MLRRRSAVVPDQYLGFSLQVNRLLWYLLRSEPGNLVSLEVLGDVAVSGPSGRLLVEETKSRRSRSNPVADRSPGLWKTIRNWLDLASNGRVDPRSAQFILHTTKPFSGDLVKRLADAQTESEAGAALDAAKEELWGRAPKFVRAARYLLSLSWIKPSQVYFPRKPGVSIEEDPEFTDEDVEAVRKIFAVLSRVVGESKGRLQAIVLDHASEEVWRGLDRIQLVQEWRGGIKLVPEEWLQGAARS